MWCRLTASVCGQVRLQSDESWSRWEVEVTPPTQSYMGRGTHKLASLFGLIFRRSSCQHPLLAGTLGRLPSDLNSLAAITGPRVNTHCWRGH